MKKTWVVANWKLQGSLAFNQDWFAVAAPGLAQCQTIGIAVCPPYPYLADVATHCVGGPALLGAQNASEHSKGAYTGEVAVAMLAEFGVRVVIVGHSERRALFADSDHSVALKMRAVLDGGLTPIVCVGESAQERESAQTEAVLARQLDAALALLDRGAAGRLILAYEPVWAIGTGNTATPEIAQAAHAFLRARTAARLGADFAQALPILYGGSVKAANASELFAQPDIDGGLIGSAALVPDEFVAICQAATATAH